MRSCSRKHKISDACKVVKFRSLSFELVSVPEFLYLHSLWNFFHESLKQFKNQEKKRLICKMQKFILLVIFLNFTFTYLKIEVHFYLFNLKNEENL